MQAECHVAEEVFCRICQAKCGDFDSADFIPWHEMGDRNLPAGLAIILHGALCSSSINQIAGRINDSVCEETYTLFGAVDGLPRFVFVRLCLSAGENRISVEASADHQAVEFDDA